MDMQQNIVITGFMGTGKTTVGRLLARRLDRRYVDMDVLLAERFGKPIAAVFAEEGEEAFRTAEAELCLELAAERQLVISTGGGALVNESSRTALAETGMLVCLTASEGEILRRVAKSTDRPLLAGGEEEERRKRIRTLLGVRRAAYGAIPYQIDTDGITPEQVAERILAAAGSHSEAPGMQRLPVRTPEGAYDLCLGDGILSHAGKLLANRGLKQGRAAIVTNDMIRTHAETLADGLRSAGFEPVICTVPQGEQHKTLATVATIYEQFLAAGLDRSSTVLALGGGVIGDMAGFAAATYLRGVPFVQLPTSLLAMVDASVGGKTGVDLPQGKNLVGAFKQPQVVIMDTTVLSTLPSDEFRSGLAEIIKHGVIGAAKLFIQLENEGPINLVQLVADAVRVKIEVVEEDPFEQRPAGGFKPGPYLWPCAGTGQRVHAAPRRGGGDRHGGGGGDGGGAGPLRTRAGGADHAAYRPAGAAGCSAGV